MRLRLIGLVSASVLIVSARAATPRDTAAGESELLSRRGASDTEIREHQALGRFVVAPHGSFFLYEWSRPYKWSPDPARWAPPAAASKQTTLYKVSIPDAWSKYDTPTSEYLFYPAPGSTYYLGSLSPDARRVAFYELSWDTRSIRAGVALTNDGISPQLTWFDMAPDGARLDQPGIWISDEEFVFPVKTGTARLARANATTGRAVPCPECSVPLMSPGESSGTAQMAEAKAGEALPANAKLKALSSGGEIAIYSVETPELLALLFRKNEAVVTLFENDRTSRTPEPTRTR